MKLLTGNKIQALDNQVNNNPSLTPKLPFSMILSANKGRGKSSLLINMLINTDFLANRFNQIHIISPTNKLDAKFNILKTTDGILKPNKELLKLFKNKMKNQIASPINEAPEYQTVLTDEDFYEKVSIDLLKQIITEQKMIIENYGKPVADNILLVYDDCASAKKFWNSNAVQH